MHNELRSFLIRSGLVQPDAVFTATALSGGVSCDVWRIETAARIFCVKRALPRLRVESRWEAPVSRNAQEWAWIEFAGRIAPHAVPGLLALDRDQGMFAMQYLDPAIFPVWKSLLLEGIVRTDSAQAVAAILARLQAASAGDGQTASRFRTGDTFYALRIEPYLLEAGRRNPSVAAELNALAQETLAADIALVHGDVSPKNILLGPQGPVFLDAETAWYGDPAFDAAFCLNHLLLKCLARPAFQDRYLACFAAFKDTYLSEVSWESGRETERRTARLLPALLLARVDGKSPVEYLSKGGQSLVRDFARPLIAEPPRDLDQLARMWRARLMQLPPVA